MIRRPHVKEMVAVVAGSVVATVISTIVIYGSLSFFWKTGIDGIFNLVFSYYLLATKFSNVVFILIFAAIVAGLTALVSRLIGRQLAARNHVVAFIVCGAIVPAVVYALAWVMFATAPQGPPPNDGPAMLHIAITTLAVWAAPVSFPTSGVMLLRKRPDSS